jgi:hypothetical protein
MSYARSGYARLHAFTANLGDWLGARVAERTGRPCRVQVLHDGTAAAQACAGSDNAAVIMLGTALGVGFPSRARQVWPLAPSFSVDS